MKSINICGREIQYIQKKSDRRSVTATASESGILVVRTPRWMSDRYVREFILERSSRICDMLDKKTALEEYERYLAAFAEKLTEAAKSILPERVRYYSDLMGVKPASVKINGAKTRFGSCSSKGSINFSYRLMAYSDNAVDYVVIHELAHLLYMDHGAKFWATVEKYMPGYRAARSELKAIPPYPVGEKR